MSRLAPAPRSGLRAVAVATLVAFGCATTREPLPPPPPAPPVERVYFEDPEMELWVEGAGSVDPAESQAPAPPAPGEPPPAG
jgi:multidrug efflux pump subunit AcrA (membrane-fusion protein)